MRGTSPKIVARAMSLGLATTLLHKKYMAVAQLLDVERGRKTTGQYFCHLKSLDPVVHCHNVMERDEDGEDMGCRVRVYHGYGELEQV
eukprot:3174594-Ditylum_brightwellii.AAC.1